MPSWTKFSTLSVLLLPLLATVSAHAQQTGTAIGTTPGSAARTQIHAAQVPPPKPTCDSPGATPPANSAPILPDLLFSREGLICVRHSDGKSEQLAGGLAWGFSSPSKSEIAYWNPENHELRVKSINGTSDQLIDTLPGAIMLGMVWSTKGRTLTYFPSRAKPPGIRVIDLDSGFRKIFSDSFISVLASPDPRYVTAVAGEGVVRFRISDGARELVAAATHPAEASYSLSGALLGVLVSAPGKGETASAPPNNFTNSNIASGQVSANHSTSLRSCGRRRYARLHRRLLRPHRTSRRHRPTFHHPHAQGIRFRPRLRIFSRRPLHRRHLRCHRL